MTPRGARPSRAAGRRADAPAVGSDGATRTGSGAVARTAGRDRWDALLVCVSAVLLTALWRVQEIVPPLAKVQLPTLSFLGAGILLLLDRDPRRSLRRLRHPITLLVALLSVLLVLTMFESVYTRASYNFLKKDHTKTLMLTLFVAASIRSFPDVRRLAGVQVLGATLYAFSALSRLRDAGEAGVMKLLYYDSNDFAMLMVASMSLAVFFLVAGRTRWVRIGAVLALGLFALGVVMSGSRGATIAACVFSLFFLLGFRAAPARRRVGAFAVVLLVVGVSASDAFWARMSTLFQPRKDYNWVGREEDGRMEIWKRGVGYMLDRPLLGVGVGAFKFADGMLAEGARIQQYGLAWRWAAAHNSWVQIGAESGITGLLLFTALIAVALRTAYRVGLGSRGPPRRSAVAAMGQAMTGMLIVYCVNGFFLSQAYGTLLYSTLALLVGLAKCCPPEAWRGRRPARGAGRPGWGVPCTESPA